MHGIPARTKVPSVDDATGFEDGKAQLFSLGDVAEGVTRGRMPGGVGRSTQTGLDAFLRVSEAGSAV